MKEALVYLGNLEKVINEDGQWVATKDNVQLAMTWMEFWSDKKGENDIHPWTQLFKAKCLETSTGKTSKSCEKVFELSVLFSMKL
jgi:hypothetical protein